MSVLVSAFFFQVPCWMPHSPLGPQPLGFVPLQPFGAYLCKAYVQPGDGHPPTPGTRYALSGCYLDNLEQREPYATQSAVPQPSHLYGGAYSLGLPRESPNPSAFPAWWGFSLQGLVPSNDTVNSESALGIKHGDSGVVIGY